MPIASAQFILPQTASATAGNACVRELQCWNCSVVAALVRNLREFGRTAVFRYPEGTARCIL